MKRGKEEISKRVKKGGRVTTSLDKKGARVNRAVLNYYKAKKRQSSINTI